MIAARIDRLGLRAQHRMPHARHFQNRHAEELYFALSRVMSDDVSFLPATAAVRSRRGSLKSGDPDRLVCDRCGFVFYLDPKVAVGTIIEDGRRRIVLVKRAIEPGYGKWVFPGGYVDRGEQVRRRPCAKHARNAAWRSGWTAWSTSTRIRDARRSSSCLPRRLVGRHLAVDDEGLEARWFAPGDVPWGELGVPEHRGACGISLAGCGIPHGSDRARPESAPQ